MDNWNLDRGVLESYIKTFYGHGSYEAKFWFVGMEFGGGSTVAEIVSRIQGWHDRGGKELEDIGPRGVGAGSRWFRPPYPLQPTWAKLIRVLLRAEGVAPTNEAVRAYQKDRLGRVGGPDCILELLPLPAPGLNRWPYTSLSPLVPYLRDRGTYMAEVAPVRAAHLRWRIAEHQPVAVVFYGSGYGRWWREITGADFKPSPIDRVSVAKAGRTLFVIIQHPAARGLSNSYFDAVGSLIAGAGTAINKS